MEASQSVKESDAELPDFDDADVQTQPEADPLALEDGEIGSASGSVQPDGIFHFMANDIDAAVKSAKRMKKTAKRRGKKNSINRGGFVSRTRCFLKEPKRYLISAAVERLGIDVVNNLLLEVKAIEANGGQMILNGNRRRTPGGVLWNIVRSRYAQDYKAIMSAGKIHEKQRKQHKKEKQKRKREKIVMVIDEEPATKCGREGEPDSDMAPAAVKRRGVTVWPSRRTQVDDVQSKVDPENSWMHMQVQNAWVEGVEKGVHLSRSDDVEMFEDSIKDSGPSPVAEQLWIPSQYDDLLET